MLKNKRTLLIVGAIAFIVLLFFIKAKSQYKNEAARQAGLAYGNELVTDLLQKDTDLDGVLDWEESLWGTDPVKKDTNDDGVPDNREIERIKSARGVESGSEIENEEENITQTDKFARELFSTVAALNQTGQMDQETVEKLSNSLAQNIQNSASRKIFTISEIKVKNDSSTQAIQKYISDMNTLEKQYPVAGNATLVLQESLTSDGDIDSSVLYKFDPIIKQINNFINGMVKTEVPEKLASSHLELINALEKVAENLIDIKLIDTDVIVALSAIAQYSDNDNMVVLATNKLNEVISQ